MYTIYSMKIIGHRGARGLAPENSLLAVKVALREKVDMIELDVRAQNGDLVLSHDEVKSGQQYTLLSDALAAIGGKVPVNLEIKELDAVSYLKQALRRYDGKVIFSSFSYKVLHAVRELFPYTEIAVLERWSGIRAVTKASLLHTKRLHVNDKVLWSGFVRSVKSEGYAIYAYTVNHRDRADELSKWGVDGICTDYPNIFRDSK